MSKEESNKPWVCAKYGDKHSYSLFITVERFLPEPGTSKAWFECACGSKLSSDEGLSIVNELDTCYCCREKGGCEEACSCWEKLPFESR